MTKYRFTKGRRGTGMAFPPEQNHITNINECVIWVQLHKLPAVSALQSGRHDLPAADVAWLSVSRRTMLCTPAGCGRNPGTAKQLQVSYLYIRI